MPDEVYADVHPHFTDDELAYLTPAVVAINSFNRFNVAAILTKLEVETRVQLAALTLAIARPARRSSPPVCGRAHHR